MTRFEFLCAFVIARAGRQGCHEDAEWSVKLALKAWDELYKVRS